MIFIANYLISNEIHRSISNRFKRITKQLNQDFWETESETAHSFFVGSYGRDTAVNGLRDLDVAFTLPNAVFQKYNASKLNGQLALLQEVRNSIGQDYPKSCISSNGQFITVNFADNITFAIIPVFLNIDQKTYTCANSNGRGNWIIRNPRDEILAFSERNKSTNGNLRAICQMARIWRDNHNVQINDLLIDTLAYQFIINWPERKSYLYHNYLMRDFLFHLSQIDLKQTSWRAPGSRSPVIKKGNFQIKARVSFEVAASAIKYEASGRSDTARHKWRELFGSTYP